MSKLVAVRREFAIGGVILTVALSYLSMIPILHAADMSIDFASIRDFALVLSMGVPFIAYACWRRMVFIPEALTCFTAILTLCVPVIVWTYAAMRLNMPLADAQLVAMDEALGFDWRSFIEFVDGWPALANLLAEAYSSFFLQLLLVPAVLALFGRPQRACTMVVAYCLLCLISSIVFIWYPALGTYVVYGVSQEQLQAINAKFGFVFLEQFHAVRQPGPFVIKFHEAAGIVTFPSVHAAVAALCAWACWDLRWLRVPALLLNVAMAVSAISHANHYLVDVIAGIGIAGLSISIATAIFYRRIAARAWSPFDVLVTPSSPASTSN